MFLFRPVDLDELRSTYERAMRELAPQSGCELCTEPSAWYASGVAQRESAIHASRAGFVLRVGLLDDEPCLGERCSAGPPRHETVRFPAGQFPALAQRLLGPIEVVEAFFGPGYRGYIPDRFGLRDRDATEQFLELARMIARSPFDFQCEVAANHACIFLNYFFWEHPEFRPMGLTTSQTERTLRLIRAVWSRERRRRIPLGISPNVIRATA